MTEALRVKAAACPGCQKVLSGIASRDGKPIAPPVAGDLTVCMYCAMLLTFTAELALRELQPHEVDALHPTERAAILATQDQIQQYRGIS